MSDNERKYWLDTPKNVDKVVYTLYGVCAAVGLFDIFSFGLFDFFGYKHHLHFDFEHWFGFYGWYGFIACVGLVLAAKQLRKVVMRKEDYYD